MTTPHSRLHALGLSLPTPPQAVATYVPYVITGNQVVVSGQLPMAEGKIAYAGHVGRTVTIEDGQKAARLCALNILSQLNHACNGDLTRVTRCVRLGGFVSSASDFTQHPQVINGASDLMVEIFGDCGRHARAAVGVSSLPLGACVEIDAIFEISKA